MSFPSEEERRQRLFFALWPDEEVRQTLARVARQYKPMQGVKRISPENLHITLAFIGAVDTRTRACLEQQAALIQLPSFALMLDQQGFWPKPQVAWLGSSTPPATLLQLAEALKRAQLACGLEPEARPFHTHLTLLRKVRLAPPPIVLEPLAWSISDFALILSKTHPEGVQYSVVRRFSLTNEGICEGLGTPLPSMK